MLEIVFQLVVLFTYLTQSVSTPFRTGDVAQRLTAQDVAALELILPSGEKPWLLNGDQTQVPNVEHIEVYVSPTNTSPALRRGAVVSVMRRITPRTEWTLLRTESYAQVAIPGRTFEQIEGDQDINRPFRVIGRFDDSELVHLVEFLRSDPPAPERVQPLPILSVQRKADESVEVFLRGGIMHGQVVKLRQVGQDWVIVIMGMWAA